MDDEFYDAVPKPKSFPWPGSANVRIPLVRIVCDSLVARYVNTIEAPKPFWSVRPRPGRSDFADVAPAAEDFMENVAMAANEMDMHTVNMTAIPSAIRRGTAVIHAPYETLSQPGILYDEDFREVEIEEILKDGVKPRHIPAEDILKPPECLDIQTSVWFGYKIRLTRPSILLRERTRQWRGNSFRDVKTKPV